MRRRLITLALGMALSVLFTSHVFGAEPVTLDNLLTKLKLKGRAAVGYFNSEKDGSYRSGSFEVPDVRLQLNFVPDEKNTLTARFNLSNLAANTPLVDYLFFEAKNF